MALVLVSNRLPVSLRRKKSKLELRWNPGGVAVGLSSFYKEYAAKWIGWPGEVSAREVYEVKDRLSSNFDCHPVFLPRQLAQRYYAGFANRTIWPLFHSFTSHVKYSPIEWNAYRKVNAIFCDKVVDFVKPGDTIWIHDYHLMLLPEMLRKSISDAKIGFFLHIPFPPYDILRLLPWHREIVLGLLGSDLIGFHTYDYSQSFLGTVRRLLGYDNEIGRIALKQRMVQVDVFPMGVDFERFSAGVHDVAVKAEMEKIGHIVGSSRLAFSISRLDYTKGIPEQLQAFDRFLEKHPRWRGRVTYLLVVVPSRERVREYAQFKRQIDEFVGRINSKYGNVEWTPIRYIYRQLTFTELLALYRSSDLALLTPLRDGMNLIAKEYLAAREDGRGVLILSEMAGAAKELLEALVVNPNNTDEVAEALNTALEMSEEEQVRRNQTMRERLKNNDIWHWASHFLQRMEDVVAASKELSVRLLTPSASEEIAERYREANRRLILLDYDGTLTPFAGEPQDAVPSEGILRTLATLSASPKNEVVLMSGRRRQDLERWFDIEDLTIVGEHGAWVRWRKRKRWEEAIVADTQWKDRIRPILYLLVDMIPGSLIEEKDFSIAWHYRRADVESGSAAAKELIDTLTNLTANLDINVLPGNKVVEIKSAQAKKGTFFSTHLRKEKWDFVLAIGDDWTDENLFGVLPPNAYSIRVGFAASLARFNLEGPNDVLSLLEELIHMDK